MSLSASPSTSHQHSSPLDHSYLTSSVPALPNSRIYCGSTVVPVVCCKIGGSEETHTHTCTHSHTQLALTSASWVSVLCVHVCMRDGTGWQRCLSGMSLSAKELFYGKWLIQKVSCACLPPCSWPSESNCDDSPRLRPRVTVEAELQFVTVG